MNDIDYTELDEIDRGKQNHRLVMDRSEMIEIIRKVAADVVCTDLTAAQLIEEFEETEGDGHPRARYHLRWSDLSGGFPQGIVGHVRAIALEDAVRACHHATMQQEFDDIFAGDWRMVAYRLVARKTVRYEMIPKAKIEAWRMFEETHEGSGFGHDRPMRTEAIKVADYRIVLITAWAEFTQSDVIDPLFEEKQRKVASIHKYSQTQHLVNMPRWLRREREKASELITEFYAKREEDRAAVEEQEEVDVRIRGAEVKRDDAALGEAAHVLFQGGVGWASIGKALSLHHSTARRLAVEYSKTIENDTTTANISVPDDAELEPGSVVGDPKFDPTDDSHL